MELVTLLKYLTALMVLLLVLLIIKSYPIGKHLVKWLLCGIWEQRARRQGVDGVITHSLKEVLPLCTWEQLWILWRLTHFDVKKKVYKGAFVPIEQFRFDRLVVDFTNAELEKIPALQSIHFILFIT